MCKEPVLGTQRALKKCLFSPKRVGGKKSRHRGTTPTPQIQISTGSYLLAEWPCLLPALAQRPQILDGVPRSPGQGANPLTCEAAEDKVGWPADRRCLPLIGSGSRSGPMGARGSLAVTNEKRVRLPGGGASARSWLRLCADGPRPPSLHLSL